VAIRPQVGAHKTMTALAMSSSWNIQVARCPAAARLRRCACGGAPGTRGSSRPRPARPRPRPPGPAVEVGARAQLRFLWDTDAPIGPMGARPQASPR